MTASPTAATSTEAPKRKERTTRMPRLSAFCRAVIPVSLVAVTASAGAMAQTPDPASGGPPIPSSKVMDTIDVPGAMANTLDSRPSASVATWAVKVPSTTASSVKKRLPSKPKKPAAIRAGTDGSREDDYADDDSPSLTTTTAARKPATTSATPTTASPTVDAWSLLRKCESGGRYDLNTGNGYYGAYQFALGTWRGLGYAGFPHDAAPAVQDEAARKLQAKGGWGQWPACTRKLGLR